MICSDIHGALANFRAAFEAEGPLDLVLIAGDLGLERWKIDQVTGVTACAIVQGNNDRLRHPDLPVHFWDERLSTVAATRSLIEADVSRKKRRKVIDKMAAVFILQGWLDSLH